MKSKLLFVTRANERFMEGFSYVLGLAKTLGTGVTVLMVHGKGAAQSFEDVMSAVAFAEAGDFDTVREFVERESKELREMEVKRFGELRQKCEADSVPVACHAAYGDVADVAVIKDFLKTRREIEMVLISPSFSDAKAKDIKKLISGISIPIITITRLKEASA